MHRTTILDQSLHTTTSMGASRNEFMASVFKMLSTGSSLPPPPPLFFPTTRGMGKEAMTFYKRLADVFQEIEETIFCCQGWGASSHLLQSVWPLCICGTRLSNNRPLWRTRHHPCSIWGWHSTTNLTVLFVCLFRFIEVLFLRFYFIEKTAKRTTPRY